MDGTELINFGVAGIVLALFVVGLIVSKKEHDRVIAERDRAWERSDTLTDDVLTKVVPALERAAAAAAALDDVLVDIRRLLEGRGP